MRNPKYFTHDMFDLIEQKIRPDMVWTNKNQKIFFEFDEFQHMTKEHANADQLREKKLAKAYPTHNIIFIRLLAYTDGTELALRKNKTAMNETNSKPNIKDTVKLLNSAWKNKTVDLKTYSRIVVNYNKKHAKNYLDTKMNMKR
jgi:hypothetical protein